ncbi:MAG: hypothetical protein ACLFU3_08415, partial [Dichotomicrobium sp.]
MQYRLLSALALAGALIVGWFVAPVSAVPASPALAQAAGAAERASPQTVTEAGWRRRHHKRRFRHRLRRKLHRLFRHGRPHYRKRRHYRKHYRKRR